MNTPGAAAARAYPNIALTKYWGKADPALHIPTTSSVSMTLDICPTTTSVVLAGRAGVAEAAGGHGGTDVGQGDAAARGTATGHDGQDGHGGRDAVHLGGEPAPPAFAARVTAFLDLVRERAGDPRRAIVHTDNEIPTGAGLASSAAGFAALAVAAADAYGLNLSRTELSRLARRGSGSAARSLIDRFAIWHRVDDPTDAADADRRSHAEPLDWPLLDMALVVVGVDVGAKAVPSRDAMAHTMATSPFYAPWVEQSHRDLDAILDAGRRGDLAALGEVAEANALGMHATMLGARPPVRYLTAASLDVLDHVQGLRAGGTPAYATMDAGPNVKIICAAADRHRIADGIRGRWPQHLCLTALPGPGAHSVAADEAGRGDPPPPGAAGPSGDSGEGAPR